MRRNEPQALDHFDYVIMAELQVRGDLPNVELARRLGLSPAATLRRVQQLRSDGRTRESEPSLTMRRSDCASKPSCWPPLLNIPKPVTPSSHGLWTACRMCCVPTP